MYRISNAARKVMLSILIIAAVAQACAGDLSINHAVSDSRQHNAAWLGVEWLDGSQGQAQIQKLAADLAKRQISHIFVYASYLRPEGEFTQSFGHAAAFARTLRSYHPNVQIQAWIGLPLRGQWPRNWGYVDLANAAVQQHIVDFCAELMQIGAFDGIHLDPEPIASDDQPLLDLLSSVRHAIGPKAILSIATPRIMPLLSDVKLPLFELYAWRASYYAQVAELVDQIAVMTYDSMMPCPALYRLWTRAQLLKIAEALQNSEATCFIGVPTSEELTWTHFPWAENMHSGLQGVLAGLRALDIQQDVIAGVAIYPYWETSDAEWQVYEQLWLGLTE